MTTSTHPPHYWKAIEHDAQRLVAGSFRNFSRRNYLIQLTNDDEAKKVADARQTKNVDKLDFYTRRRKNWCVDGVLPREVFYGLIRHWLKTGALAANPITPEDSCKANPAPGKPSYFVDVGITFQGFLQIDAHTQLTDLFRRKAPAYAEGAYWRAAEKLGDTGPHAPPLWDTRYLKDHLHAVLIVHTKAPEGFASFESEVSDVFVAIESVVKISDGCTATPSQSNSTPGWIESSHALGETREIHFGMIDGLSAPRFFGISTKKQIDQENAVNVHSPGELLLGHIKNDKSNPWLMPGAYAQEHPTHPLNALPARNAYGNFFKNGSFGVLRRIRQNVPEFESFVEEQAEIFQGSHDLDYFAAWLKAKIVGRWPNGERVSEYIDTSIPGKLTEDQLARTKPDYVSNNPSTTNQFVYQNDRDGLACPFGAHIRRMNPRDDPVVPKLRRPLLRKGLPYGKKYEPKTGNSDDDRGLLGLFFCSSVEEQFEHLMGNWANNNPMGMPFTQAGKDPLIGNQELVGNRFEIPRRHCLPLVLEGLQAFVQTRGTCYAFFPSLAALKSIEEGKISNATRFLQPR